MRKPCRNEFAVPYLVMKAQRWCGVEGLFGMSSHLGKGILKVTIQCVPSFRLNFCKGGNHPQSEISSRWTWAPEWSPDSLWLLDAHPPGLRSSLPPSLDCSQGPHAGAGVGCDTKRWWSPASALEALWSQAGLFRREWQSH